VEIPVVVRDFQEYAEGPGHPDFDNTSNCCGVQTGIVEPLLDSSRKPVYAGTDTAPIPETAGRTAFDQWYRDVPGVNFTFYESLTLLQTAAATYAMSSDTDEPWYSMCGFFPVDTTPTSETYTDASLPGRTCTVYDSAGFGNEWMYHNYGFTTEVRYWFEYRGGETLTFSGDDDFWVFLNATLAIDLGGVHDRTTATLVLDSADGTGQVEYGATPGSFTSVDLGLSLGNLYEVAVFHAERYCCGSNYNLTLDDFLTARSICTHA
jgi:fibro-slime domain-containing protein